MATIKPFAAVRPPVDRVARIAAPPYDVINSRAGGCRVSGGLEDRTIDRVGTSRGPAAEA